MKTHADKTQENKDQSVANTASQKQSGGEPTFQCVDNRPEAIAQRKLQKMVNNSPQAKQAAQLQGMVDHYTAHQKQPIQKRENNTGLPDNLKSGIENLSGYSMDDVKVHYNSDKPARLQAHAYAQGIDIYLGAGQEKHLPHEAWHVVQQKQGRVKPTMQMKDKVNINDTAGLEKEADVMGIKAMNSATITKKSLGNTKKSNQVPVSGKTVQRKIGFEFEMDSIRTRHTNSNYLSPYKKWEQHDAGDLIQEKDGYNITADIASGYSRIEFVTDAFDEKTQLGELKSVILRIIADIGDIRRVSQASQIGYLAGVPYTGAGETGYLAGDGWVGINKIPRVGGSWRSQMEYAPTQGGQLAGQLQMTAGFNIAALQKLMSGEALGFHGDWEPNWNQGPKQFLTNYAQYNKAPSKLYQSALTAVESTNLCSGAKRASNIYASILSVMAQMPINGRHGTYDFGNIIAKTDYAKLLIMAQKDTRLNIDPTRFTNALLQVINAHISAPKLTPNSTVFPATPTGPIDLGKVTIKDWVKNALPKQMMNQELVMGNDKMTQKHYPGTDQEKTAMRTFGPYKEKTDPGEKAIFELRSMLMSPVTDLVNLVNTLTDIMKVISK